MIKNRSYKLTKLKTLSLALPVLFLLAEVGYYYWIDSKMNDLETRLSLAKIQLSKYDENNKKVSLIKKQSAILRMKSDIIKSLKRNESYSAIFDSVRQCLTDVEPQWKTIRLNRGPENKKGITYHGMIVPNSLIDSEMLNSVKCIKSSPDITEVDLVKNEYENDSLPETFKLILKPSPQFTEAE